MNQLEITQQYVTYQSQTQLVNLAQTVATSRSKTKPAILQAIQVGTQIRLGLEALNYSAFLTKAQIDEILYLLSDIASINGFPFAPTVTSVALPTILLGVTGPPGVQGIQGVTGGGFPFLVSNITTDQVIDEFPITLCGAAEWIYDVHSNTSKRVERLVGCWLPDGSQFRDDGGVSLDPEIGNTSGISFYINYAGGNIQLIAHVTSGIWTVAGSRIQIPVNGNGIILPSSLTNGTIWIGTPANTPAEWAVTGDISLSNAGVANISPGVIVDADVNATAAIAVTKLAALPASLAVVTNGSGFLTTSLTTASQIGFLSNVTSDVQAQLNSKLTVSLGGAVTGDILYFNGVSWTNFARGTAGQLLSSTAGTIAWVSGGSGITNTALTNEMMKSNGVNAVSSGMFSTSFADLILGSAAVVGSARNLSVQGSAPNINLFIQSKGTGNTSFYDEAFTQYLGASKTNFLALYTIQSELQLKSALTSTVGNSLRVSIKTSGTPVAGIGVGIEFQTQTGVATDKIGSVIQSISTNVGAGTEAFDIAFFNMAAGAAAAERMRILSTGVVRINNLSGAGTRIVTTDPSGNLGSTPAGAAAGLNTQVQYNNGGSLAGDANFTWILGTQTLNVGGTLNITGTTYQANRIQSAFSSFAIFGQGVGSGVAGNVIIQGGTVSPGSGTGGDVYLAAGTVVAGTLGKIQFNIGQITAVLTSDPGGGVFTETMTAASTAVGVNYVLQAGTPTTGNSNGGSITIKGGVKAGTGVDGTIAFTTANLTRATILDNGNFGIGITAPTSKLHVVSTATEIAIFDTSTATAQLSLKVGGVTKFFISHDTAIPLTYLATSGSTMEFYPGGALAMRLALSTLVVTVPGYAGGGNRYLKVDNAGVIFGSATVAITAGAGTASVTADSSGNLQRSTAVTFDVSDNLILADGKSIFTGLITGTEFGGSALQKLSFWGKTPIVQPTTAIAAAARVAVGGGVIQVNDTYGGYSIGKIAQALINAGILA